MREIRKLSLAVGVFSPHSASIRLFLFFLLCEAPVSLSPNHSQAQFFIDIFVNQEVLRILFLKPNCFTASFLRITVNCGRPACARNGQYLRKAPFSWTKILLAGRAQNRKPKRCRGILSASLLRRYVWLTEVPAFIPTAGWWK